MKQARKAEALYASNFRSAQFPAQLAHDIGDGEKNKGVAQVDYWNDGL